MIQHLSPEQIDLIRCALHDDIINLAPDDYEVLKSQCWLKAMSDLISDTLHPDSQLWEQLNNEAERLAHLERHTVT